MLVFITVLRGFFCFFFIRAVLFMPIINNYLLISVQKMGICFSYFHYKKTVLIVFVLKYVKCVSPLCCMLAALVSRKETAAFAKIRR